MNTFDKVLMVFLVLAIIALFVFFIPIMDIWVCDGSQCWPTKVPVYDFFIKYHAPFDGCFKSDWFYHQ